MPDKKILETFFRAICTDSEVGYVLFGEKPICLLGYPILNDTTFNLENDILFSIQREGVRSWQKLSPRINKDNNYLIVPKITQGREQDIDLLVINKRALLKTISENIALFQNALGSSVSTLEIYNKIVSPDNSLMSALNFDKALIGIVLGFGAQNSLYGSRHEYFEEQIFAPIHVPNRLMNVATRRTLTQREMLPLDYSPDDHKYYKNHLKTIASLSESEFKKLEMSLTISSPSLSEYAPRFLYAGIKGHEQNNKLIQRLENEQLEIIRLLESDQFFEMVLSKFGDPSELLSAINNAVAKVPSGDALELLITRDLAIRLKSRGINNGSYIKTFIDGMRYAFQYNVDEQQWNNEHGVALYDALVFSKVKELKQRYQRIDAFFDMQSLNSDIQCVIPKKLMYTIEQQGSGRKVSNENTRVLARYQVISYPDEVISDSEWESAPAKWINLSQTVEGFAKGCVGMQVGETRKIYIHPDLAYGAYIMNFHKGACLIAKVKLIDISNEILSSEPLVSDLEDDDPMTQFRQEDEDKIKYDLAFTEGVITGIFYKPCNQVMDFEHIFAMLSNHEIAKGEIERESDLRSLIYWWVYQRKRDAQNEISASEYANLVAQADIKVIIPNHVLYQRKFKNPFTTKSVKPASTPLIHYKIKDVYGNVYEDTTMDQPKQIDLKRTIRGLRFGLTGLMEGEKGILFISPEYGFRFDYHRPCADIYLIVEVEIVHI